MKIPTRVLLSRYIFIFLLPFRGILIPSASSITTGFAFPGPAEMPPINMAAPRPYLYLQLPRVMGRDAENSHRPPY